MVPDRAATPHVPLTPAEIADDVCRAHALSFSWEACTHQFLDNLSPFDPQVLADRQ